jgi:hypothetical protein
MTRKIAVFGAVITLGTLAHLSAAVADEQKVPLKDVPKVILDAVKAKFPDGKLKEASKETEEGKTTYEIALNDKGSAVDVTLTADGTIAEIETEVSARDLPKAVASTIEANYPGATVKKAEKIVEVKANNESKSYEVVLVTAEKKTIEVKLSPEGKILHSE